MKQMRKRIVAVVLALLILAGCVAGGFVLWKQRSQKPVKVYSIGEFSMTEYWGDSSTTDGMVGVEGLQMVQLSDTQTVTEVLVQPGDQVKEGDPLITYDTTLTELDLKKKNVSVQQLQLDLGEAQKELSKIKTYKPGVFIPGSVTTIVIPGIPAVEEPPFVEDGTVPLVQGDGSYSNPFVYEWKEEYSYNDAFFYQCMRGLDDAYVMFVANGSVPETEHVPDEFGWYMDEENHWQMCTGCGSPFDVAEHNYIWVIDQPASLAEPGSQHEECAVCGYVKPDSEAEIPQVDHEHQASTAWAGDSQAHWHLCVLCGEKMDKSGHDFHWVVDKEPTDAQPGQRHQECTVCGYEGRKEEIPATGGGSGEEKPDEEQPEEKPDEEEKPDGEQPGGDSQPSDPSAEQPTDTQPVTAATPAPVRTSAQHPETGDEEEEPAPPEEDGTQDSTEEEPIRAGWMMQFQKTDAGYVYQLLAVQVGNDVRLLGQALPALPPKEPAQSIPSQTITDGIKYTKEEITQMRSEAEMKVKELDLELRKAQLEYEKAEKELNNGAVYSELDGKVSSVLTEEEARNSAQPIVQVTAGGGFYIQGSVSELLRDTVQPGQTVTLRSWQSGVECEGTVKTVSDYPTQGSYWNGNNNVSLYPFTVFVPEDAGFQQGEYVEITYGSDQQSGSGFYLESMFLRSENGRNYVYVVNADGKLEKRYVATGKSVWGSYTEIKSGLSLEEYVAFPYGDSLRDGVETEVSTINEFYGW